MQPSPAAGGKKNEDDSFDVEAAALTGGVSAFRPLAGVVRALPPPISTQPAVMRAATAVALQLDKAAIAMDARPQLRAVIMLYFLLLHLFVLL
jgi:hypothetical protein